MSFGQGFAEFFFTLGPGLNRTTNWPNAGTTVTWDPPKGVYWVWVKAVAGGGGGGGNTKYFAVDPGGGGGGAGEGVEGVQIQVQYGVPLSIYVGGGGPGGIRSVTGTNVHAGPLGSTAAGSGFGGENTVIGPIRLQGGFGGVIGGTGHGGMGGGAQAGPKGQNPNTLPGVGTNNGDRTSGAGSQGWNSIHKDNGRFYCGSGGGASSQQTVHSGDNKGGPYGPFEGGAEGSTAGGASGVWGGAGGGASCFGPGGAGGAIDSNAPAVPSGSYGAGGGGCGGVKTGVPFSPTQDGYTGARGGDGYVSLHYLIVLPHKYTLQAGSGSYSMTGNTVNFTYP